MFNLTKQEQQAVIFLVAVLVMGTLVSYTAKHNVHCQRIFVADPNIAKIDLNNADRQLLVGLPGIGEKLAERIICARQQTQGFASVDQLLKVKGITRQRYEKIKDNVFVKPMQNKP